MLLDCACLLYVNIEVSYRQYVYIRTVSLPVFKYIDIHTGVALTILTQPPSSLRRRPCPPFIRPSVQRFTSNGQQGQS